MSGHYLDSIGRRIGERCDMDIHEPHDRRLLRIYAVLCLALGEQTENRHVHDAWAVDCRAEHPCAVPYDELPAKAQALDTPYRDAIRAVAQEMDVTSDDDIAHVRRVAHWHAETLEDAVEHANEIAEMLGPKHPAIALLHGVIAVTAQAAMALGELSGEPSTRDGGGGGGGGGG